MTDGLAILGAWLELAVIVGGLIWFVLRRAEDDPVRESRHAAPEHPPKG